MVADFYTKPLQGKLFRMFRNLILNCVDTESEIFYNSKMKRKINSAVSPIMTGVPLQECVENIVKLKSRIAKLKPLINDTRAIVNDSSPEILDKLMTLQTYKNDIT